MDNNNAKNILRSKIASEKKKYTPQGLREKSDEVLSVLEITGAFQDSKKILIYNNLPDEVVTMSFIEKWEQEKEFYLPVVTDKGLVFRQYQKDQEYIVSNMGILEPQGIDFLDFNKVDMIIIPGVAFDRKMNRMGRGRGYYDRFLPKLSPKIKKVGICFDFQLLDSIPHNAEDIPMDMIVSENDLIW